MPRWLASEPVGSRWLAPAALAKRLALLPRSRRLLRVELTAATSATPAVVYVGEGESLGYLARLHSSPRAEKASDRVPLGALPRLTASRPDDELWYLELNRLLAPLLPSGSWKSHPWITQKVQLGKGSGRRAGRAREGTYGRRIRQHGLSYRLETEPAAIATFYRELYLPYVRWRFGDACHPRPQRQLERAARSGFLLQVRDRQRWLAGVVCRLTRNEVTALAFGLSTPYAELLHRGALSAASYFLIQWAESERLDAVNLLRSRPHLGDGVFEHKRRLGATPCWDPWPHTTLAVLPPGTAALPRPAASLLVQVGGTGVASLGEVLEQTPERPGPPPDGHR